MAESARKGDRTREDILEAAYQLFLERGYSGTSTRDIARCSGLALGGLYNHFGGKEDIFAAVLFERHPYVEIIPALDHAAGGSLDEVVRDAARRMAEALRARPAFLNLMFVEMVEFRARHVPELVNRLLPALSAFGARFADAQARGDIRDVPLPIILRAFMGLFLSFAITEPFAAGLPAAYRDDALDHFVDIFLNGVNAGPRVRGPRARGPRSASGRARRRS